MSNLDTLSKYHQNEDDNRVIKEIAERMNEEIFDTYMVER